MVSLKNRDKYRKNGGSNVATPENLDKNRRNCCKDRFNCLIFMIELLLGPWVTRIFFSEIVKIITYLLIVSFYRPNDFKLYENHG